MVPGAHVINRLIVPVRSEEAKFFGLDEQALLLYVQRVRTADGQPIFEENVFLPYEGNQELLAMDLEDVSLFDTITQVGGRRPVRTPQRTVEAVRATQEQATRLVISAGDPLLFLNVCFADENDEPGRRPVRTPQRTVEAVRATQEQATRLVISAGDPLLFLNVCFADENDEPVCIGRQYYVGTRYRFVL